MNYFSRKLLIYCTKMVWIIWAVWICADRDKQINFDYIKLMPSGGFKIDISDGKCHDSDSAIQVFSLILYMYSPNCYFFILEQVAVLGSGINYTWKQKT